MSGVLGIDIGTTAIKAVVLDEHGAPAPGRTSAVNYGLASPRGGWFEQDPAELRRAIGKAVAEVAGGKAIAGVGLSTQAGALILLDENDQPIGPIYSWMDGRAKEIGARLVEERGQEFFAERSGRRDAGLCPPLLRWLGENKPGDLERAARISFVDDWCSRWMTGVSGTDGSNGAMTGLLNIHRQAWDGELMGIAGVNREKMPRLLRAGEALGELRKDVVKEWSLGEAKLPGVVMTPMHDQHCAALGGGVTEAGQVMLSTGTAWVLMAMTGDIGRVKGLSLFSAPAVTGGWGTLGALLAGNGYYDQVVGLTGLANLAEAEKEAAASGAGAKGLRFHPCVGGKREAGWSNWRLDHRRGDMCRAVMEGMCVEARGWLGKVEAQGSAAGQIVMMGGSAKSTLWASIAASILGRPVVIPGAADAAALGAAVIGGIGAGWWRDAREGREKLKVASRRIEPDFRGYRDFLVVTR
ncbi:MAG: FGGY-family carbohydrate kinase [Phycisphaeraceae bacterium]|nr:FGGY-family carbohydrate kinase [Phycisphaeraceae bacterium]